MKTFKARFVFVPKSKLLIDILWVVFVLVFPIFSEISEWAYGYYECQGNLKNLQPCFVGQVDIVGFIGFGLFWCKFLWAPALIVAGFGIFINHFKIQKQK